MEIENSSPPAPASLIVIGASMDGITAIKKVLAGLPDRMNAAVAISHHGSSRKIGVLPKMISDSTSMPVLWAEDQMPMQPGHVYLADKDLHLSFSGSVIRCTKGPRENGFRPSIDVMMRSAGVAFRQASIGVILTGMLDDGTAGAIDLKACGGTLIVQDPEEALYDEMPLSAIAEAKPDFILSAHEIGPCIESILEENLQENGIDEAILKRLQKEVGIAQEAKSHFYSNESYGDPSDFSCPECGGPMWKLTEPGSLPRLRCHTGHSYTFLSLEEEQRSFQERALYTALRIMEERSRLLRKLETQSKLDSESAKSFGVKALEIEKETEVIRSLLTTPEKD